MQLQIVIQMDNATFADAPMSEVARILREYAKRIEQYGDTERTLRDINGNAVGYARLLSR